MEADWEESIAEVGGCYYKRWEVAVRSSVCEVDEDGQWYEGGAAGDGAPMAISSA